MGVVLSRKWKPLAGLAVISGLFLMAGNFPGFEAVAQADSGRELYIAACSNCHGINGDGVPQEQLGFEDVPADFTDCSFASREPAADWIIVAHEGGPIRGFSRHMPAFGDALSYEELSLIMDHVKAFCIDKSWPDGSFNLPRPMFTGKAYPEDEYVYSGGFSAEGDGEFFNKLIYEKRFGARNQFEIAVPFSWKEGMSAHSGKNEWNGGVGDIAMGLKRVVYDNLGKGSIFSVSGEVKLPTGNEDKGFGKGTPVFEPFVTYGQILPSEFFLQTQAGFEVPFDDDKAEDEAFWRAALGRGFTQGPFGRLWAPMVGVLGSKELEKGGDINWDVVPQMHFTLNTRQHIMMNIAVRVPITDAGNRDTQILFYLLWDWFDGGFFDGW